MGALDWRRAKSAGFARCRFGLRYLAHRAKVVLLNGRGSASAMRTCMHVDMHAIHMHAHMHMHTHTCARAQEHTHLQVFTHTYTRSHVNAHVHVIAR